MAFAQPILDAIARLITFYNGNAYDAGTNAGGLAEGGHRQNFEPALQDLGAVVEAAGTMIDDADLPDIVARSDEYRASYLGALAADPATDGNGDPVAEGQAYFNTTDQSFRVYDGANWIAPAPTASGYVPATGGTFSGNVTFNGELRPFGPIAKDLVPSFNQELGLPDTPWWAAYLKRMVRARKDTSTGTLDLQDGSLFVVIANGPETITILNPTDQVDHEEITVVILYQTADSVTWPAGVKWPGGVAPVTTGANTVSIYRLIKQAADGSAWWGSTIGENYVL